MDLVAGAVDSPGGYVSKILHVKTKESGSVGGGRPPRSANELLTVLDWYEIKACGLTTDAICSPCPRGQVRDEEDGLCYR